MGKGGGGGEAAAPVPSKRRGLSGWQEARIRMRSLLHSLAQALPSRAPGRHATQKPGRGAHTHIRALESEPVSESWARYQFCRIYFKICRRGAPAKILKKFAVGPDFHQDLSNLRCGVGGWVRVIAPRYPVALVRRSGGPSLVKRVRGTCKRVLFGLRFVNRDKYRALQTPL